jgi:signal peptidase I
MNRTLQIGDYVLVNKLSGASNPGRDRIVLFKGPLRKGRHTPPLLLSRCVGMPGDTVQITDSEYLVNGRLRSNRPATENVFRIQKNIRESLLDVLDKLQIPLRDAAEDSFSLTFRLTPKEERMIRANLPQVVALERVKTKGATAFTRTFVIPKDHYWMLSDNKDEAIDSRYLGLVPRHSIVGNVWFCWLSKDRQHSFRRIH